MTIWIITASYQGTFDGIEIATLDEELAQGEYRRLVREAMGFADRDNPWEDVAAAYEKCLEDYRYTSSVHAVEEYHLDTVEVT